MPAFGKNGVNDLRKNSERKVWNIVDPDGKVLMVCNNKEQAASHRKSLSQMMNKELSVQSSTMRCL